MAKICYLVFSFLLITCFQSTLTLKCYVCDKCNDPFQKEGAQTVECPGVCLKQKVLTDVDIYKKGDVERSCLPAKAKTECTDQEKDGHKATICFCDKDLCNGSDIVKITMATGVMAIIGLLINIL